jgi:predicted nucleic acid-binding protein
MRLVFLDSGPLGILANPTATPSALACNQWANDLLASNARIIVPAIADYEVRRELIRAGKVAALRRLDFIRASLEFDPITQAAFDRAAELWAFVRTGGRPTAAPEALDGDCILAAQILLAVGIGDVATIATKNSGHLSYFLGIDAQLWEMITP